MDIPQRIDLPSFLGALAGRRGRKIYLHPFDSGQGIPCGLWLGTAVADHICYEQRTTPWHQTHIILHEAAHMILGHGSGKEPGRDVAGLLAPDVDPVLARLVMGRSVYTTDDERQAETLASLLLAGDRRAAPPALEGDSAALLARLDRAWGVA